MQGHALADAATPQDAYGLAGFDDEADVIQHPMAAERLAHVLKFDIGLLVVVHRRFCARANSPGVFRLSNIRVSKARSFICASSILWTAAGENSASILFFPSLNAASARDRNSRLYTAQSGWNLSST